MHHALEFAECLGLLVRAAPDVQGKEPWINRIGVKARDRIRQALLIPEFSKQPAAHTAQNRIEDMQRITVVVADRDRGETPENVRLLALDSEHTRDGV